MCSPVLFLAWELYSNTNEYICSAHFSARQELKRNSRQNKCLSQDSGNCYFNPCSFWPWGLHKGSFYLIHDPPSGQCTSVTILDPLLYQLWKSDVPDYTNLQEHSTSVAEGWKSVTSICLYTPLLHQLCISLILSFYSPPRRKQAFKPFSGRGHQCKS